MIFYDKPIVYTFGTLALIFTEDRVCLGVAVLFDDGFTCAVLTPRGRQRAGLPPVDATENRSNEGRVAYQRRRNARLRAAGLCVTCARRPARPDGPTCQYCVARARRQRTRKAIGATG